MSTAWYRLLAPGGTALERGDTEVTVEDGILELRTAGGPALRVPSSRISSVVEPEPFTVLVVLSDGTGLELTRLGRMRTQLLEELRDARAAVAATESGAVGADDRFSGVVDGARADLHVYEDALLVVGGSGARRVAFAFVTGTRARDYTVTVEVAGQGPLAVTRLGRRTDEFAALLTERVGAARTRTSAFLGSLLPGLDPVALRAAAGLLRDGVAAPAGALDAIHPGLSATLLRVATLPGRLADVTAAARRADLAIGFKQLASVHRPAVGVTSWRDPAAAPHLGEHETPGGRFGAGLGGVARAGLMSGLGPGGGLGGYDGGYGGGYGGPFGGGLAGLGGYWAFRALGALGAGGSGQPALTPRADVHRGLLTPQTEDLAALTVAGEDPTVLAFALLSPAGGGGPVCYTVLNLPEAASYAYRADGPDPRVLVNQALDDAGFAPAGLHAVTADDLTAAHRRDAAGSPLAEALAAVIAHDAGWQEQVARLLG